MTMAPTVPSAPQQRNVCVIFRKPVRVEIVSEIPLWAHQIGIVYSDRPSFCGSKCDFLRIAQDTDM